MESIEQKKAEASMLRAKSAIADLEVARLERLEDIKRIETNIVLQQKVISDIEKRLRGAGNG